MFAGVAMQASRSGDTQPIRVATTGVFEFDCLSTTFEVGDLMASDENAGGTALLNQTVRQSRHREPRRRPLRQARQPGRHPRAGRHRQHHRQGRPASDGCNETDAGVRMRGSQLE